MSLAEKVLLGIVLWVAIVLLARFIVIPLLRFGPERDPVKVLIWRASQFYLWLLHRARYRGQERLRRTIKPGGLVVISNHTSSLDPMLIQCGCNFSIRWLMAKDMMIPQLDWLWKLQRIIPVSRDGSDSSPVRQAIRHVRGGGAVGIFPEARIVRPGGEIRPFHSGVGAIVARTGAPVMIVWVSGTPTTSNMTQAFFTPSRSKVEYVDVMEFDDQASAQSITEQLRARLSQASGWPLNDEPMPPADDEPESLTDVHAPRLGTFITWRRAAMRLLSSTNRSWVTGER
jgi:1-acyl-sn-glycerol-3-phosphate acyltransferase